MSQCGTWLTVLYVVISLYFLFYYLDIIGFQSVKRGKVLMGLTNEFSFDSFDRLAHC